MDEIAVQYHCIYGDRISDDQAEVHINERKNTLGSNRCRNDYLWTVYDESDHGISVYRIGKTDIVSAVVLCIGLSDFYES